MGSATAAIFTAPNVLNANLVVAGISFTDSGYYLCKTSTGLDFNVNAVGDSGAVKLKLQGSTASCVRVYVDDVLQSNPTIDTGSLTDTTLVSGLAAGAKKISIRFVADAYVASINSGLSPQLTVTATGTPTIGLPTGWTAAINFPTSSVPTNADVAAGIILGSQGDATLGATCAYNDAPIRANANGTALWIWTLLEGCCYGVEFEGDEMGPFTVPNTGGWGWVQLAALNPATVVANGVPTGDWSVYGTNVALSTSGITRIGAIAITGGTGITATAITAKTKYGLIGDSIPAKIRGDYANSTQWSIPRVLSKLLNVTVSNFAVAGDSISLNLPTRVTSLLALAIKPTNVILRMALNDEIHSYAIGDASTGDTKILNDAITSLLAGVSGTIYVMLVSPSTNQTAAAIAPYNTMLRLAVATAASSRVQLIDTTWATMTADLASDGYHGKDIFAIKDAAATANQITAATFATGEPMKQSVSLSQAANAASVAMSQIIVTYDPTTFNAEWTNSAAGSVRINLRYRLQAAGQLYDGPGIIVPGSTTTPINISAVLPKGIYSIDPLMTRTDGLTAGTVTAVGNLSAY